MNFSIFYKSDPFELDELAIHGEWDCFVSAFNTSDRVQKVFEHAKAINKIWVIHPQYNFPESAIPTGPNVIKFSANVSNDIKALFQMNELKIETLKGKKICIDSTGFMRPDLMFLVMYLYKQGIDKVDFIYSEPIKYINDQNTKFSKDIGKAKAVPGFDLVHKRDSDEDGDLLIIAAGYDTDLIREVVEARRSVKRKVQLFGFPSLQADMYQQNILKAAQAADVLEEDDTASYYAPANDPFVTATVIQQIVDEREVNNLYLAPLSTKAQTLGMALYYIVECLKKNKSARVLIPEIKQYSEKTSEGVGRIWKYEFELAA